MAMLLAGLRRPQAAPRGARHCLAQQQQQPACWQTAQHGRSRTVYQLDTMEWMRGGGGSPVSLPDRFNVVTSLPDISELRQTTETAAEYEAWFIEAVRRLLCLTPPSNVAVFYQTPGRFTGEGGAWLDKATLCMLGAREAGAACVWRKVVLLSPPGTRRGGVRPSFVDLLCFSRAHRVPRDHVAVDVLPDRGYCAYPKAMGEAACVAAVEYCRLVDGGLDGGDDEGSRSGGLIVDPFCGYGSSLAVANAHGMDAVGMDVSVRCCRRAAEHVCVSLGTPSTSRRLRRS